MSGERQRPASRRSVSSFISNLFSGRRSATTNVTAQSSLLPIHADPSSSTPANYSTISPQQQQSAATSDQDPHRLPSAHAALATPSRPPVAPRALTVATTKPSEHPEDNINPPELSRPQPVERALTSTEAIAGRAAMETRPSLFSRAKQAISDGLELGEGSSYAHKSAPPAPSHWENQQHWSYLVRIWEKVDDRAANSNSKYAQSTTARLVSTEKNMLHQFPELGEGKSKLTREWIEYVLGVALKHPFCTTDKMGRWEVLASSSGTRGTWGPW